MSSAYIHVTQSEGGVWPGGTVSGVRVVHLGGLVGIPSSDHSQFHWAESARFEAEHFRDDEFHIHEGGHGGVKHEAL